MVSMVSAALNNVLKLKYMTVIYMFLCPIGRVLTTEGRVRSGNAISDFLTKRMNAVCGNVLQTSSKQNDFDN